MFLAHICGWLGSYFVSSRTAPIRYRYCCVTFPLNIGRKFMLLVLGCIEQRLQLCYGRGISYNSKYGTATFPLGAISAHFGSRPEYASHSSHIITLFSILLSKKVRYTHPLQQYFIISIMNMVNACSDHRTGSILPIPVNTCSYDFDYDLPYPLTESLEDLDANFDSILGSVQAALFDEEDTYTTFDPTPIGPQGMQIVNKVKLTEIPSVEDVEMLTTFLYPHMRAANDNENASPSHVTSSRSKILPKKKSKRIKHFQKISRTSFCWSGNDDNTDMPYPLSAAMETDLDANLDDILGSVQAILFDEDLPCTTFDPTSIGPQGMQIVREVKLTEIPSVKDDMLMTFLYPHMGAGACDTDNARPSHDATSSSSKVSQVTSSRSKILPKKKSRDTSQEGDDAADEPRFRPYQEEQWEARFQDLVLFHKLNGHCLVPRNDQKKNSLVTWVWRQRYQQRCKQEGKKSTLTNVRQARLDELGFVWDSHKASWDDRVQELVQFREQHGHCNSNASNNPSNQQLAIWIKCQRKQYRHFLAGKSCSGMSKERISKLESVGFCFAPRRSNANATRGLALLKLL
jgi:hypothetical protein